MLNTLKFQRNPAIAKAPEVAFRGQFLELMGGVEPPTFSLRMRCSAIKLHQQRNCPDDRQASAQSESWKFLYAVRRRLASCRRRQRRCVRAVIALCKYNRARLIIQSVFIPCLRVSVLPLKPSARASSPGEQR